MRPNEAYSKYVYTKSATNVESGLDERSIVRGIYLQMNLLTELNNPATELDRAKARTKKVNSNLQIETQHIAENTALRSINDSVALKTNPRIDREYKNREKDK